jgi:L-asparaginase II
MPTYNHQPLYEFTRGRIVESVHSGSVAVVNVKGQLVASYGDSTHVTFLRSTAKPFQAIPFIELGGATAFQLTPAEIALTCASHSGTDDHVAMLRSFQAKTGIDEHSLLCGIHPPYDEATAELLRQRDEQPTPNRHNCSGKHSGMLSLALYRGWSNANYIDLNHPVQELILGTFSEMTGVPTERVEIGIDGCSAPNFAVPLLNAALSFARLCDPVGLDPARAAACRTIVNAMSENPVMVAGPGRFDTLLMEVAAGRIIAKGGAEGYQGIGLLPDAIQPGSPALGIAIKISDGDLRGRARPAVTLEILRQLGALSDADLKSLAMFGPCLSLNNWRDIQVGEARPCFEMNHE